MERAFGTHCTRRLTHQHYVVSLLTKGPLTSKRRVYHELPEFPRGRNGGKYGVDIWGDVPAENRAGLLRYDNALHPMLPGRLIRMTTNPGDLVADPFFGGGSTVVACLKTGRRFYGGDRNPHALRFVMALVGGLLHSMIFVDESAMEHAPLVQKGITRRVHDEPDADRPSRERPCGRRLSHG